MKAETKFLGIKLFDTDVRATAKVDIPEFVVLDFPGIQTNFTNKVKVLGLTVAKHKAKGWVLTPFKVKSGPITVDVEAGS